MSGKITRHQDSQHTREMRKRLEESQRVSGQEAWSMDREEWKQLPENKAGQRNVGQALSARLGGGT